MADALTGQHIYQFLSLLGTPVVVVDFGGQKLVNMLPRKRVGHPQDLDALLVLLASGESGFVNGAIIAADDGFAL